MPRERPYCAAPVSPAAPSNAEVDAEARRILRRLQEPGAFLLVSRGLDQAGAFVIREDGSPRRVALVPGRVVLTFWQRGWIAADKRTPRVAVYRITTEGRAALRALLRAHAHRKLIESSAEAPADPLGPGAESIMGQVRRRARKAALAEVSAARVRAAPGTLEARR